MQGASMLLTRRTMMSAMALAAAPLAADGAFRPAEARAEKLGLMLPRTARVRVGDFEVTIVADSEEFIDGPYPVIGKNATKEEVRVLMQENFLPDHRYQPGFSPAILNTGSEVVLFDTGNGENGFIPRPKAGWLAAGLSSAGFKAEDIDVVALSHGHPDHVGGLIDRGAPLFPNARYVISASEYDYWAPAGKHQGDLEKLAAVFRANTSLIKDKFSFLRPGEAVVPGVTAIEAYGHTPGHLAFRIESKGQTVVFWGDCAHHHVASLARPDWHCVFDIDKEKAATTRERMFAMIASERVPVIGYHMPFPSIGYVEKLPLRGYRWVPHTYQLAA